MTRYALKDKIIDDLNHYVWYEREKFDGNPNGYLLVERCEDEDGLDYFDLSEDGRAKTYLRLETTHFMYIEWPEVSNEQD